MPISPNECERCAETERLQLALLEQDDPVTWLCEQLRQQDELRAAVVRECAAVCAKYSNEAYDDGWNGCSEGAATCADRILALLGTEGE
jgi:hypothetical protein